MAKRDAKHQISLFRGQASAVNRDSIPLGMGRLVYNFNIENNILKKIPGSRLYLQSALGHDPVRFLRLFNFRWIYQIGTSLIYENGEGLATETLVSSALARDTIFATEWRAQLYLANGTDLKYFDGTTLFSLGILPPGLGKTPRRTIAPFNIAAGALPAGQYDYTFTYFDTRTQTESLPIGSLVSQNGLFNSSEFDAEINPTGWIFYSVTIGASRKINIPFTVSSATDLFGDHPSRANQINIYRRDPGQSTFRLLTSFAINDATPGLGLPVTTGLNDEALLATLGDLLIPDDLNPPPTVEGAANAGAVGTVGPKYVRFWRDVLFLFGAVFPEYTVTDTTKGVTQKNFAASSILYASDTFLPDYYPFDYEIGRNDGQLPTGLAVAQDTLIIFKERSIYLMLGTNLTNFVPKIIDPIRGCIAPGSLQETPLGAIFLAEDGICVCNGAGPAERVSEEIDDEIKTINRAQVSKICSYYDRTRSNYRMYFPSGTSKENNRYLEFNVIRRTWVVGVAYAVSASAFGTQSTLSTKIMVGKPGGRIVEASNRAIPDDDGKTIQAIFRSEEIDFGIRGLKKKLQWLYITAASLTDVVVDIRIYSDYAQGPIFELAGVDAESFWAEYAASIHDQAGSTYDGEGGKNTYGGPLTFNRFKIPISGVGRTFYVEIVERQNDDQKTGFEIHSIEVDGDVLGK